MKESERLSEQSIYAIKKFEDIIEVEKYLIEHYAGGEDLVIDKDGYISFKRVIRNFLAKNGIDIKNFFLIEKTEGKNFCYELSMKITERYSEFSELPFEILLITSNYITKNLNHFIKYWGNRTFFGYKSHIYMISVSGTRDLGIKIEIEKYKDKNGPGFRYYGKDEDFYKALAKLDPENSKIYLDKWEREKRWLEEKLKKSELEQIKKREEIRLIREGWKKENESIKKAILRLGKAREKLGEILCDERGRRMGLKRVSSNKNSNKTK